MRQPSAPTRRGRGSRSGSSSSKPSRASAVEADLDDEAQARFDQLKAWRSGVAKSHGLPAYVILQNVTLAELARVHPGTLDEMAGISGIGAKKLEAYGEAILEVLNGD
jgi:ATP-dependent DNA helicase RecQ